MVMFVTIQGRLRSLSRPDPPRQRFLPLIGSSRYGRRPTLAHGDTNETFHSRHSFNDACSSDYDHHQRDSCLTSPPRSFDGLHEHGAQFEQQAGIAYDGSGNSVSARCRSRTTSSTPYCLSRRVRPE